MALRISIILSFLSLLAKIQDVCFLCPPKRQARNCWNILRLEENVGVEQCISWLRILS